MNPAQANAYLDLLAEMGIKAGLEHTRALAAILGDPQSSFPSVLVAGTNGKGSVSVTLASILGRSGYRVGLFTSPHLVDVRERIRIGGECIRAGEFALGLSEVRRAAEGAVDAGVVEGLPTHFEALALLGFLHFARERVELGILEVGLGGRWDCTNIVEPVLSVVTSISEDHEEWLGKGIRNIAREKAGIFRPSVPALTGATRPEVLEVLEGVCRSLGAPLGLPGECAVVRSEDSWRLAAPEGRLEDLPIPALKGEHQWENTVLACRAGLALRRLGWRIPDGAFREGIALTRWPGRLQEVGASPAVFLDGAHNPDGCRALARFVRDLPHPRVLVFAAMRDKPVEEMLGILAPLFDRVVTTQVPMERCIPASEIPGAMLPAPPRICPSSGPALDEAKALAGPAGSVVVAGSLYLVGKVLESLGEAGA